MIPKKESNRRLLLLAKFLEELKRGLFNYGHWTGEDWGGKADLSCGTTACALGWASAMPVFNKLGLILNDEGVPYDRKTGEIEREAALRIFGLDADEAGALFMGDGLFSGKGSGELLLKGVEFHKSAKEVAKRIRKFIEVRD